MTAPAPAIAALRRAEQLGAALPPLLVAAERVAATVVQGMHGRRRTGPGDTFWQFRRYEPGDPLQRIDWRQSARTGPLFVREMEWAAAQSLWLWRDGSPSMGYRSRPDLPRKMERADLLTLALASLLVRGGERVALLGGGERPASGRGALERLALQLTRTDADGASLPPAARLPRHARIVLIGDFLSPLQEIDDCLRRHAECGVRGHLVQVIDPAEAALPFTGRVRFAGMEAEGEHLLSRVETVRDDYAARFKAHVAGLAAIARALDWSLTAAHTDRPAQAVLLALYLRLADPARFRAT